MDSSLPFSVVVVHVQRSKEVVHQGDERRSYHHPCLMEGVQDRVQGRR